MIDPQMVVSRMATGWLAQARQVISPNQDERPAGEAPRLIVIHAISLPPGQFGGDAIERLFTNRLAPDAHPCFRQIHGLRVSSHFLIRRDGELVQFVATSRRAWHAGRSCWRRRTGCNDFSIGIELEGSDEHAFTDSQYARLNDLMTTLCRCHAIEAVVGHADIAPGRKTDPGPHFDWSRLIVTGHS